MQMMNILKPIAFDVIHCVSQLFDYYLYAVYTFFGRNDMYESEELEKSVYQDYDSDSDVADELKQDYVDEQTGDAPLKRSVAVCTPIVETSTQLFY